MKIDCQRFYLLDGFTEKGYSFMFRMDTGMYQISIIFEGLRLSKTNFHDDADSAMSEALKWLRKQTKKV